MLTGCLAAVSQQRLLCSCRAGGFSFLGCYKAGAPLGCHTVAMGCTAATEYAGFVRHRVACLALRQNSRACSITRSSRAQSCINGVGFVWSEPEPAKTFYLVSPARFSVLL